MPPAMYFSMNCLPNMMTNAIERKRVIIIRQYSDHITFSVSCNLCILCIWVMSICLLLYLRSDFYKENVCLQFRWSEYLLVFQQYWYVIMNERELWHGPMSCFSHADPVPMQGFSFKYFYQFHAIKYLNLLPCNTWIYLVNNMKMKYLNLTSMT